MEILWTREGSSLSFSKRSSDTKTARLIIGRGISRILCAKKLHGQQFANIWTTSIDFIHPTTKRYPHFCCTLKGNAAKRSFSFSCHGLQLDGNRRMMEKSITRGCHVE